MDLKTIINQKDTIIVDVREPYEFMMGRVEGALNIPVGSIMSRLDEFEKMGKPIVLYCRSGNRSGMAAAMLKAKGIKDAYNAGSLEDVESYLAKALS